MVGVTGRFQVRLPFQLNVIVGSVQGTINIPLTEPPGEVVIYPPIFMAGIGSQNQSPEIYCKLPEEGIEIGAANGILIWISRNIEPTELDKFEIEQRLFVDVAFDYVARFIRYCRWRTSQHWLYPEEIDRFYGVEYVDGSGNSLKKISHLPAVGYGPVSEHGDLRSIGEEEWQNIETDIMSNAPTPLSEELLLQAKFHLLNKDYRSSYIHAAVALEAVIRNFVAQDLKRQKISSNGSIDRIVNRMNNPELTTVMLGLLTDLDWSIRESCNQTFRTRNEILHRSKPVVFRHESEAAISVVEKVQTGLPPHKM